MSAWYSKNVHIREIVGGESESLMIVRFHQQRLFSPFLCHLIGPIYSIVCYNIEAGLADLGLLSVMLFFGLYR